MAPFITLLAALVAITGPLAQAVPMPQAAEAPRQDCAAAQILAQGIAENIEDQKNEKLALAQVAGVLQKDPVDANAFAAAKANLLTFVNNGIAIRQANQAIAPLGNKAEAGLAIVADAQLGELNLSQGLTGDPATDADAIQKLNDGFDKGLEQNQQNMADALAGCQTVRIPPPAAGGMMANGTQNAYMGKKNNNNKADKKQHDDQEQQDDQKQQDDEKQQEDEKQQDDEKLQDGQKLQDAGAGHNDAAAADAAYNV